MKLLFVTAVSHLNRTGAYLALYERIKEYARICIKKEDIDIISIIKYDSFLLHLVKKIFRIIIKRVEVKEYYEGDFCIRYISIRQGIYRYLLWKLLPNLYSKKVQKTLDNNVNFKKYDLVSIHYVNPIGYPIMNICKKFSLPYIVTLHGSDINEIPNYNTIMKREIISSIESAEKALYVSKKLIENAKKYGCNITNAVFSQNGITNEKLFYGDRDTIKTELGLNGSVIGFVGNLYHIKRADKFAEIFTLIKNKVQNVKFIIIGDGYLRSQIESDCKRYGIDVRFYGLVNPEYVAYYMKAMDILILPSRNEGWPCVVLEAFACGTNVVASDVGGIPEAITDYGFIVQEGKDFEGRFAESVKKALAQPIPATEITEYAKKFMWSNIVKDEFKIVQEILVNWKGRIKKI